MRSLHRRLDRHADRDPEKNLFVRSVLRDSTIPRSRSSLETDRGFYRSQCERRRIQERFLAMFTFGERNRKTVATLGDCNDTELERRDDILSSAFRFFGRKESDRCGQNSAMEDERLLRSMSFSATCMHPEPHQTYSGRILPLPKWRLWKQSGHRDAAEICAKHVAGMPNVIDTFPDRNCTCLAQRNHVRMRDRFDVRAPDVETVANARGTYDNECIVPIDRYEESVKRYGRQRMQLFLSIDTIKAKASIDMRAYSRIRRDSNKSMNRL